MSSIEDETQPVAIVDVQYFDDNAVAACVVAKRWLDAEPFEQRVVPIATVQPYRPGVFFERELPCVLQVLAAVRSEYRAILIDGYVDLDERGTPGLGGYLHAHFDATVPVVGVAKTAYRDAKFAAQVRRGTSGAPLFVTARGLSLHAAARIVERMHGPYRIPTLIKWVDRLARTGVLANS